MHAPCRSDDPYKRENGMEIVWSDLAMRDLNEVALYVSEQFGDTVSEKTVSKIVERVERLRVFPTSGVLDRLYSSSIYTVHHVTLTPNVIYYLLEDDAIVVISIIHVKRSTRFVNKVLRNFLENYAR